MKRSISERSPSGSSGASSRTSPVLSAASDCTTSSDSLVASEISSGVGSRRSVCRRNSAVRTMRDRSAVRSEEHTPELQSQSKIVCRLLLEKKKKKNKGMDIYALKIYIADSRHSVDHALRVV